MKAWRQICLICYTQPLLEERVDYPIRFKTVHLDNKQ